MVSSGTTPSQPKTLRHLSLDTSNWDMARNLIKRLQNGKPAVDPVPQEKGLTVDRAIARYLKKKGPSGENISDATLRKYHVEAILRNHGHLRETAQRLIRRGIVPQEGGWKARLGRNQ